MSFSSQGFAPEVVKALAECGYEKLTPIQQKAIPMARKGHDIFATAQTGTGKTAAFSLPMIQQLLDSGRTASRKPPVHLSWRQRVNWQNRSLTTLKRTLSTQTYRLWLYLVVVKCLHKFLL